MLSKTRSKIGSEKITRLFFFSTILLLSLGAQAATFQSPEIHYTFVTKDLVPIEGVNLMAGLQYEVLSVENCTGWICVPSLPHFVSKTDGAAKIAESTAQGVTVIPSQSYSAKSFGAKNLQLMVYTNGYLEDLCGGQKKDYYEDHITLFLPTPNHQGVEINAECETKTLSEGDPAVEMYCVSGYTNAELQALKTQIIQNCY